MKSGNERLSAEKSQLHPRNRNRKPYDFEKLILVKPELQHYMKLNKYGVKSLDFANPDAVKLLNQALLHYYYGIKNWNFPDENLCPPIPGRADYIHYIADLLADKNNGKVPIGNKITVLDIGVGANCIYPIIGVVEYGWNFIGADVDEKSIQSVRRIMEANEQLSGKISCRLQSNPKHIFAGIIEPSDKIDVTICNPPFHASADESISGTRRKIRSLSGKKMAKPDLNFAGVSSELIYEGGEYKFIHNMITESKEFTKNVRWFTTLVSKSSNLNGIYKLLEEVGTTEVKTISMATGNKATRVVAWRFDQ
ncbi:MAG: 23S rRNA (adenine1618-N6)-methyltransferase [Spirosomataceae bacterium]|jgi:23S rRNA (adenine1618-N6)-methyltransferase